MVNLVGKVLGGVAKAPGAVVGFAGATAVGTVGGAIKATGKGIVSGAKAASKLKTKVLGEAAEAAAKGSDDVVKAAAKKGANAVSPPNYNYRQRVQDGVEIFERQPRSGKGKKKWESISSKDYADARRRNHTSESEFSDQLLPAPIEVADDVSKTAAGDGAGVNLLQFASEHPVGTALAGLGVGVVGANIFDDDE